MSASTSPPDLLQAVLVGFGHWGQVLYPKIRKVFRNEIYIAVRHPERIPGDCIPPGAKLVKADPERFPPDARAWFIASPSATHFDWVMQGLKRNAFIFCEKPLYGPAETSRLALSLIKKERSVFQMNFVDLWNPGFEKMLELVSNLDRPAQLSMHYSGKYALGSAENIIWELGPHAVACALKLGRHFTITDVRFDARASRVDLVGANEFGAFDIHLGAKGPKRRDHVLAQGDRRVRYLGDNRCVAEVWRESESGCDLIDRYEYCADPLLIAIRSFYQSCMNPEMADRSAWAFEEAALVDSQLRKAQQRLVLM